MKIFQVLFLRVVFGEISLRRFFGCFGVFLVCFGFWVGFVLVGGFGFVLEFGLCFICIQDIVVLFFLGVFMFVFSIGVVFGSFFFVVYVICEYYFYYFLNDYQDLFKGFGNLVGAWKGKGIFRGGVRCVKEGYCRGVSVEWDFSIFYFLYFMWLS